MAYLTEAAVLKRAAQARTSLRKSVMKVLAEASAFGTKFDVFLSHSSNESEELLLGTKMILEDQGLTVYVDRYGDPQLSPDAVTSVTAEILRTRMRNSKALLYLYSRHSTISRWMPWELGFFDGLNGRVGIIPVTRNQESEFRGEEYLSLYPYIDQAPDTCTKEMRLWINRSASAYAELSRWIKGADDIAAK